MEVAMKGRAMQMLLWAGVLVAVMLAGAPGRSGAAEWVHEGMAEPGKWTAGFRVGPSFITQPSSLNTTGPALNFQALYGINRWFRLGSMLDWERHGLEGRSGSLDTITILPLMLEYRPGHFGALIPYLSTGIGVNINTKDTKDTFAWRTAGGLDYALTNWFSGAPKGLMLNTEVAWKRNAADIGEASSISMLFGVRYTFN
jgi:outer membrane protein